MFGVGGGMLQYAAILIYIDKFVSNNDIYCQLCIHWSYYAFGVGGGRLQYAAMLRYLVTQI